MKPVKTLVDEAFSAATGTGVAVTFAAATAGFAPELALFGGFAAVFFAIITLVKLWVIETRLK